MTVDLKPEQERVIGQAIRAGLIASADEVVDAGVEAIRRRLETVAPTQPPMSAEEWIHKFRDWAYSHPTDTPLLDLEPAERAPSSAEQWWASTTPGDRSVWLKEWVASLPEGAPLPRDATRRDSIYD